jgi:hypothetical protein
MASHGHTAEIRNPGPYKVPGSIQGLLAIFAVVGIAAFAMGLNTDAKRTWFAFVHNHFYFLSLALGGMFFAAIQWITSAMWSAPVRRVGEALTAYLPVALVMFIVLYFGMHHLYVWTHADHVKGDIVLEGKAGYLNQTFFFVRNLVAFGLWIFFAKVMIGNSLKQDSTKSMAETNKNKTLSPAFLLVFGVTFTMASFDLLMSLDPHWFSTMFGVYCFAGLFYSVLALICILTVLLMNAGALKGIVNDNHLHDLGKFMFAFTVFWAYIGFSQFMLIWYANLPEETGYFMLRFSGHWMWVSVFLLVGKFATPFFLLLPRDAKRNPKILVVVGLFMLFAQWIDMLWITQPELYEDGPHIGWQELGVMLGFVGLFGLAVSRFLSRHNVVAIGDPRLAESVHHHHQ